MNLIYLLLIDTIVFILLNFMPVYGAFFLAKRIAPDSPPLKYALMFLLYFIQCAANFALLGVLGMLDLPCGMIASVISGAVCYFCARKYFSPALPETSQTESEFCRSATVLQTLSLLMLILLIHKASILPGTDTYLYHLYYPAMWLTKGKIFAVTLPGLPHEYFPVFGETLYGWLLLSGNTTFVPLLQCGAWAMSLLAAAALWRSYKIPSIHITAGIWLCVSCGILVENTVLSYTDSLTGAFLATGISLLILALNGKITDCKKQYLLAALAGLSLGISAAIKYSGLVLAPIITLLLLIWFFIRQPSTRRGAWIIAGCASCAAGVYYIPNLLKTGNPFYPVKIPLLFPQGIDFERGTIPFSKMWSYFVNDNPWDMNRFTAFLLIGLIAGTLLMLLLYKNVPNNRDTVNLSAGLLIILLAAEFIMLMIYPAMTQARQIIPFVMSLGILFPSVLSGLAGKFLRSKESFGIYTVLIIGIGLLNLYYISNTVLIFIAAALFISLSEKSKYRIFARSAMISAILFSFFYFSLARLHGSVVFIKLFGGDIASDIVMHLRHNHVQGKTLRIASVGSWFNYMLMLDMPGNDVVYIPVNQKNTSHPHEVASVAELRDEPVSYPEWKQRLHDAECHYLIIDLESHQDFLTNRDLELRWAIAHPEDFELICKDNRISFFRIK